MCKLERPDRTCRLRMPVAHAARGANFLLHALYCAKVNAMFFAHGHIKGIASDENAIMSAHFAAKCTGEAAAAVMSQHVAQQSNREGFGNRILDRY